MKLSLTLPTGLKIEFEGDPDDFDRFSGLIERLPALTETLGAAPPVDPSGDEPEQQQQLPLGSGDRGSPLDPKALSARFTRVGATNHIERVTVIAQAAVEDGQEGVDFPTTARIYAALAIPKPGSWKNTFGNAKTKGLVLNVSPGRWKPTIPGENFARYGQQATGRTGKRRTAPGQSSSTNGAEQGGEDG
jgi:hypothetical protein